MTVVLMTGFPGFLGSALLPRILARRTNARALLVVQDHHLDTARWRVAEIEEEHPETRGRIDLLTGDITLPGLGMGHAPHDELDAVTEVWHLAAVYDLGVGSDVAHRVNVDGTANVLDFCRTRPRPVRLHHVSTCYVSGSHDGVFAETDLDTGQQFRNHYESTKYDAEVLVRKAMADGLRATIYRPGIVVGDSATGETQKYDGPYFVASFLRRQPKVALMPAVAPVDDVRICLVPRNFVIDAMDVLSATDMSVGRTYALTDPNPPTVRQVVDTFARRLGKRVVWVPLPTRLTHTLVQRVPGLEWLVGFPAEAVDYFSSPTLYDTQNTTEALVGTGVACPPFAEYAERLLDFMLDHPEYDGKAMV